MAERSTVPGLLLVALLPEETGGSRPGDSAAGAGGA